MAERGLRGNLRRLDRLLSAGALQPEVEQLNKLLRRSGHVLSQDRRQLRAQILLRLRPESAGPRLQALHGAAEAGFRQGFRPAFPSEGDGSDGLLAIMRHGGAVTGAIYVAEARGGPRVLSWSGFDGWGQHGDGTLRWWDAGSGAPVGMPMRHDTSVRGATYVAAAPGGPGVLSWSEDATLRWWDEANGAPIGAPMRHDGFVLGAHYVAEAPGGPRVLSWSSDGTLRWWDAASGAPIGEPMDHEASVRGASYVAEAPGGPRVLSWSGDHTLRWWDAASGAPIGESMRHDDSVWGAHYVAEAPGGPRVLSWSEDQTLRWW
ncbi:MAG: hypothetical protein INF98_04035, partial [Roseomonas sp.]|nr:hypothetical protein [Roseomonas sp.]